MSLYGTVPAALAGTINANGVASGVFEAQYADPSGGRRTVLTFKNASVALADDAGTKAWLGPKIYTLADGLVVFEGAVIDLTATPNPAAAALSASAGVVAAWNGDVSLGSSAAINAGDASPDGVEVDLIALTSSVTAVAGVGGLKAISTTTEAPKSKDGTSSPFDIYLTLVVDDADQDVTTCPTAMLLNGTVTILWKLVGDK